MALIEMRGRVSASPREWVSLFGPTSEIIAFFPEIKDTLLRVIRGVCEHWGVLMKRQKRFGYDGGLRVKLRDGEGFRRGARNGALIWLLALAMAVLRTADASA